MSCLLREDVLDPLDLAAVPTGRNALVRSRTDPDVSLRCQELQCGLETDSQLSEVFPWRALQCGIHRSPGECQTLLLVSLRSTFITSSHGPSRFVPYPLLESADEACPELD